MVHRLLFSVSHLVRLLQLHLTFFHAGKEKSSTVDLIIALIEDEDRLVRESACLSLAYLRSTRSVPYIVDRWLVKVSLLILICFLMYILSHLHLGQTAT